MSDHRSLLSRDHRAYAALAFPLVTGLIMARGHTAAALFALASVAGFMAREPTFVALGHRGPPVQPQDGARAWGWAIGLFALAALSAVVAIAMAPQEATFAFAVPVMFFVLLVPRILAGADKSLVGDLAAPLATALMVLPVALAGSVTALPAIVAAAIVWCLTFVIGACAQRARGTVGDDHALERGLVIGLSGATALGAALLAIASKLTPWLPLAAIPAAIVGLLFAIRRLDGSLAWALLGADFAALALLLVGTLVD